MKTLFAIILMSFGITFLALGILVFTIALWLTIIGFESMDGPIIWERIFVIACGPVLLGCVFIAGSNAITSQRSDERE